MEKFFALLFFSFLLLIQIQNVNAQQTIKFGTVYFYPPFIFTANQGKTVFGFDIDIAKALCDVLSANCTFTTRPLSNLFSNLDKNEIDAGISALSITPERKFHYDFTLPYFKATVSYLGLKTKADFANTSDTTDKIFTSDTTLAINNKKIGVVTDSNFEFYLKKKYGNTIKIITYPTNISLIEALIKKEVDLILADTPVIKYWVNNTNNTFKIFFTQENAIDEGFGIVVSNKNPDLVKQLNNALVTITQNGMYDAIKHKYFSLNLSLSS